jgi:hypothetical protein
VAVAVRAVEVVQDQEVLAVQEVVDRSTRLLVLITLVVEVALLTMEILKDQVVLVVEDKVEVVAQAVTTEHSVQVAVVAVQEMWQTKGMFMVVKAVAV